MTHVIRLGFPWCLLNSTESCLEFSRVFHRPTGLGVGQEVQLVVACAEAVMLKEVGLNGQLFPIFPGQLLPRRLAIGRMLESSNRLTLKFVYPVRNNGESEKQWNIAAVQLPDHSRPERVDISRWATVSLEIDSSDEIADKI